MESNSVLFMFNRIGLIVYDSSIGDENIIFEKGLEAGVEDVSYYNDYYEFICHPINLKNIANKLNKSLGKNKSLNLSWRPITMIDIVDLQLSCKLINFINDLNNNDDVQNVFTNFKIIK